MKTPTILFGLLMTSLAQAIYVEQNEKEAVTEKNMKMEKNFVRIKATVKDRSRTKADKKDDLKGDKSVDKKDDSSDKKNTDDRKGLKKDDDSYGETMKNKNRNEDGKKLVAEMKPKEEASSKAAAVAPASPDTDKGEMSANPPMITSDAFRASGFIFTMVSIFIFF